MTRALYYPPANTTVQWFNDTFEGADITPNVAVWHTTETGVWPSYSGGASAPHLTYNPANRLWRQHSRLDRSARALRNLPGGVETNTLNACQVEIIAYSDEALARSRGHLPVSKLSKANLADLADFAAFMWNEWGLKLQIDPGWVRSNYRNPKRMTGSQWRNFYGHTGHNRVPENTHWDPAALDIDTIIDHAQEDDMPTAKEIVDELMSRQISKVDPDSSTSPTMSFQSYVRYMHHYMLTTVRAVVEPLVDSDGPTPRQAWDRAERRSGIALDLLQAQQPLIEAAAAGKALSEAEVQEIAASCAAAIPDALADDVVDELAERLQD